MSALLSAFMILRIMKRMQDSWALAQFTLSPTTKSCEKAGAEFTRILPAVDTISQKKPEEQSWLDAY